MHYFCSYSEAWENIHRKQICKQMHAEKLTSDFYVNGTVRKYFSFSKSDLVKGTTHPKFDPAEIRTHDVWIVTVHFMSLRH